ncbi:MAG: hypothetical protein PHN69_04450 [Candidatus Pacebacteria bacterium]|nr:hypothetical protein [Fermentimonas sp.]MDD4804404.1 hypothetical protein [Candidatus Paceibacterota bacterium]
MTRFSQEFKTLWDTEVKPHIINNCIPEYAALKSLPQLSSEDQKKEVNRIASMGYHDFIGQLFIGDLVWTVEHALADDRIDLNFTNSFYQVYGVLNDDDYWQHNYAGDPDGQETKNIAKLRDYINKLAGMI